MDHLRPEREGEPAGWTPPGSEPPQAGILTFSADDLVRLETRASMLGATAVWRNEPASEGSPIRVIRPSGRPTRPSKLNGGPGIAASRSSRRESTNNKSKQRRKRQPDKVTRHVRLLAGVSWFLAVLTLGLVAAARPEQRWAFDNWSGRRRRVWWNEDMLQAASFIPLAMFAVCIVGIWLNSKRMRRAGDRYNRSILVSATVSVFAFALVRLLLH